MYAAESYRMKLCVRTIHKIFNADNLANLNGRFMKSS
jgi:hypothetical protein